MAAKRTASASDNGEMPAKRATGDGNFFPSILETAKAVANQSSAKLQGELAGKLIKLKGLVREKAKQLRSQVQATDTAQHQLDVAHLNLQNILYEKLQVLQDIKRCQAFRPLSKDMDLIEESVVEATDPSLKDKPHEKMLARLAAERKQRESLCQQLEELEARQTAISAINSTKKKQLKSLPAAVKSVVEATEKAVGTAGLKSLAQTPVVKDAKRLPEPLAVLFQMLMAYKEVTSDMNLQVTIEGDSSAVKSYLSAVDKELSVKDANVQSLLKEGSRDTAERGESDDSPRRKGATSTVKASGPHPLALDILIDSSAADGTNEHHIKLRVEYFARYSLVAVSEVESSLESSSDLQAAATKNILQDLYHGDSGDKLPRTSTAFEASLAGQTDVSQVLAGNAKPYAWLQLLCGLPVDVTDRQQHLALVKVVADIKQRVQDRAALVEVIGDLESADSKSKLPKERSLFPIKGHANVGKATALDVHDGDLCPPVANTSRLAAFKTSVSRSRVSLEATCLICSSYPAVAPLFRLSIAKSTGFAISDANLAAIALETNLHIKDTLASSKLPLQSLLLFQLREIQMCLDLMVEAADRTSGSGNFKGQLFTTASM